MANAKARRNILSKVKINGVTLTNEEDVKSGVCRAYRTWLSENKDWRPRIGDLQFRVLGTERSRGLEVRFPEEEVFKALCILSGDKALGPDGFTMAFWQFSWEFTKIEIMAFFGDLFRLGIFQRSLNATFLVVIPKEGGAEELKDFRLISLVGSLYKLLTKVLTNRLKLAIGEVVSEYQHAFFQDRQILDVVLIANEAVDSRLKDNLFSLLLKLDTEKAFDHVNWDCFLSVMSKMGFGQRWINWIRWCISTTNFLILINGPPSDFFHSTKGLRQGDPSSPYLLLVMETLSQLLFRARSRGFIEGFKVGSSSGVGRDLLHLLFADDTLLFCEANSE